ncbi:homoserine dehydrogenase [Paenalkalicoccus suaedae]|uniref:Homoserine dehydrogenase n=1 Tax=Paenalkalicoccus suaedae TaxID=2592382 RepID=A0A859FGJ5_9BACI|nr:homoserine dehydrogenase [Paenalkalicoccus suaedae]QKS72227.1 homoserine dehydrogenase [Paenalkalicoccus suaedae]
MAKEKRVAIAGFGTVGTGVYEALYAKRDKIEKLIGGSFRIPVVLVKNTNKIRPVSEETLVTNNVNDVLAANVDTVVEVTTDATTAYPLVRQFLQNGITVVTANKELVAKHGEELLALAKIYHCRLYFEAAVAGGIPILTSLRHTLKTNDITRIEAIVNGTSNFILSKMRKEGAAFDLALEEAQANGYAEAVPDKDIDGWDAYYKSTIISHWLYGQAPVWAADKPRGIRGVDVRDLVLAERFDARIKHVATIEAHEGVVASVEPKLVLSDHSLYGVEGVNNGIHVEGSIVGQLLFQGPGAGKFPTASAIIEDVINHWTGTSEQEPESSELPRATANVAETADSYFLVTANKLPSSLENTVEAVSAVERYDGREAVIVRGTSDALSGLEVVTFAVTGDVVEASSIRTSKERVVS